MNTTESFIAHLIELRTRLMHSVVALLLVFIALFPWAANLYSWLARPLLAKLPKGAQMIATDVTTPFFVRIKVAMITGVSHRLTLHSLSDLAFRCSGAVRA